MGKLYIQYFEGNNIYGCKNCDIHLTSYNELISKVLKNKKNFPKKNKNKKAFRGRHGKAYLFNNT